MQRFNFSYDKDYDDLFMFNGKSHSKGSVELGNLIFDFNNKNELVGIQIINASEFLKNATGENKLRNIKRFLNNLKECRLDIKSKQDVLFVKIYLVSNLNDELSCSLVSPHITQSSPALLSGY